MTAEWYGKHFKEVAVGFTGYSTILWVMVILALIKKSRTCGVIAGVMFVIANIFSYFWMKTIDGDFEGYVKSLLDEVFED